MGWVWSRLERKIHVLPYWRSLGLPVSSGAKWLLDYWRLIWFPALSRRLAIPLFFSCDIDSPNLQKIGRMVAWESTSI
jgi:hypothetical protein